MSRRWRPAVMALLVGLTAGVGVLGGQAAAAPAAGGSVQSAGAQHVWTVHYYDKQDRLVRTVHEPRADAASSVQAANPAMSSVHCDASTNFRFHRDNPKQPVCFSGSGSQYIYVPYVYSVESDAWTGHYIANGTSHWISPYTTDLYASYQTVSYLGLAS